MPRATTVFVIMPFVRTPTRDAKALDRFFDVDIKQFIENDAALEEPHLVSRSDTAFEITKQIFRDLYDADVVICDLSGENANPNVMLELGIRLASSDKPTILIREDLPTNRRIFDVSGFHTFSYKPDDASYPRGLQEYVQKKLVAFASGSEPYESPILSALRTSPSVIDALARRRVESHLRALHTQLLQIARECAAAIVANAAAQGVELPRNPVDLAVVVPERLPELETLNWESIDLDFPVPPALQRFLSELPLQDLVPPEWCLIANSYIAEFWGHFFAARGISKAFRKSPVHIWSMLQETLTLEVLVLAIAESMNQEVSLSDEPALLGILGESPMVRGILQAGIPSGASFPPIGFPGQRAEVGKPPSRLTRILSRFFG